MSTDLYTSHRDRVRAAFATSLGASPEAFETESLTVVDRPEPPPWPYAAAVASFGTGTLISIDPALRGAIASTNPRRHYSVYEPDFLARIVEAGSHLGLQLSASSPGIGWGISAIPEAPLPVPAGYDLQTRDADWMAAEQASRRFENGVGEPGVAARDLRNRFASVLFDADGQPAAVAGAFLTYDLLEIGVDVARAHRGRALAPIVVGAVTRAILDAGESPFYACAATNTRSQKTALASGFQPLCSMAYVAPSATFRY